MTGRLRLWSGYVLFFYVVTHLLNHALGLVSLRVLEEGRHWFTLAWSNPAGQILLYGSLLAHFLLALWSLYRRRALKLSRWEWTQWILGAAIIPLGAIHVAGTRLAADLYDVQSGYPWVLGTLVAGSWTGVLRQFSLPLVVWMHGCIGLHFALRLKPWYRDWLPLLYGLALLIPAASLAGAGVALRDVAELAQRPGFLEGLFERAHIPAPEQINHLYSIAAGLEYTALALLAVAIAARPLRDLWERRAGVVRLSSRGSPPTSVTSFSTSDLLGGSLRYSRIVGSTPLLLNRSRVCRDLLQRGLCQIVTVMNSSWAEPWRAVQVSSRASGSVDSMTLRASS